MYCARWICLFLVMSVWLVSSVADIKVFCEVAPGHPLYLRLGHSSYSEAAFL